MLKRHLLAGLIAPLFALFLYCLVSLPLIYWSIGAPNQGYNFWRGFIKSIIEIMIRGVPLVYVVQLAFGFPLVIMLKFFGYYSQTALLVSGLIAGILMPWFLFGTYELIWAIKLPIIFAGIGNAWLYWKLAKDPASKRIENKAI